MSLVSLVDEYLIEEAALRFEPVGNDEEKRQRMVEWLLAAKHFSAAESYLRMCENTGNKVHPHP